MNGLDLCRAYFFEEGLPLIKKYAPHIAGRCAAGLCAGGLDVGCGSEVYGYDDELSRDHNWGPRFFLFLTEDDYEKEAERLRAILAERLNPSFRGSMISPTTAQSTHFHITSPRRNAAAALCVEKLPLSDLEWFTIPECRLCEYAAGEIFYDPLGIVDPQKKRMAAYPANVLLKRLAGAFFMMHTAGNALRCARRGEWTACRTYADMAVTSTQRAALLLAGRFPPHAKWRSRAARELPSAPMEWTAAIDRLAIQLPQDEKRLEEELLAILIPVGEMANVSGLITPVTLRPGHPFLNFACYELSKAFEAQIKGELAGRPLAIALDQMSEGFQPHSVNALLVHWKAGRPGISRLI